MENNNWVSVKEFVEAKKDVGFAEVVKWLEDGLPVKLPEWDGFWIKDDVSGLVHAHTKEKTVVVAQHYAESIFRKDWILLN